jgi:hypothetical protein
MVSSSHDIAATVSLGRLQKDAQRENDDVSLGRLQKAKGHKSETRLGYTGTELQYFILRVLAAKSVLPELGSTQIFGDFRDL